MEYHLFLPDCAAAARRRVRHVRIVGVVVLLLISVPRITCAGEAAPTITVDRRIPPATLSALDSDFQLRLEAEGQSIELSARELVLWGGYRDDPARPTTLLVDGTALSGNRVHLDSESVRLMNPIFGAVALPRSLVRGVAWSPPLGDHARDLFLSRLASERPPTDRLYLASGDVLSGEVTSAGLFDSAAAEPSALRVLLQAGGREVAVGMSAATAVALGAAAEPPDNARGEPARRLLLGLADGSLLVVRQLELRSESVRLTTRGGARLDAPAEQLWSAVTLIQPLGAATLDYLSDRPVESDQQIPFFALQRPWRADRNVLGGRLRAHGRIYLKGIGMCPASRLSYRVQPGDQAFHAELALDQSAASGGSVVFRVFLARPDGLTGQASWQPVYASPVIRGGQPLVPVEVDLRGATELALIVEFAERGDERDYANWLNARIVKRP